MNVVNHVKWGRVGFLAVILTVFASPAGADDASDKESKLLDGTWKFVSLTVDGDKAPSEFVEQGRWSFRGNEITIPGPAGGKSSFKLDPGRTPKTIEMTATEGPGKGKTALGIYKIEENRLTICFNGGKADEPSVVPPEAFSGEKGKSLLVLERIKKE